jgi:hypothetical protein
MDWLTFFIASLACYRVTILICRCLGPFRIFQRLRLIEAFSDFLRCVFCVSIWIGGLTCVALYLAGWRQMFALWVLDVFAFSAVTIALDRVFSSDHVT